MVLLFLVYNGVARSSLYTMKYYEKPIAGRWHLQADFRVTSEQQEQRIATIVAWLTIVVMIIGMPLSVFLYLRRHRDNLMSP
jgi:hypothetical protein